MPAEVMLIYGSLDLIDVDTSIEKEGRSALNAIQGKSFPPLGLLYLAAVLEKEKINVGLIDLAFLKDSIREAVEIVKYCNPKVVGIYVCSFNLYLVSLLISRIRRDAPACRIVIGGPHVHYCPDSVRYLNADFGVVSDGEYSFLDLTKGLLNGRGDFSNIPNVVTKTDTAVVVNEIRKIEDLDSLPFPARHLWPHREYFSPLVSGKTTAAITSRGCLFGCKFCALPDKGTFRLRSAANVIEEFISLQRQGFRYVELQDDFFTYDKERVAHICEDMISKRIGLKWTCLTRVDFVDKELLRLMKRANCTHIKYGIESGSEFIRNKIMHKSVTDSQIKNAIRDTKAAGIFTVGYFLLGAKGESLEDIKLTLGFARELNLDYVDFNLMVLIPGSEIFEEALREKRVEQDIWEKVSKGEGIPYCVSDKAELQKITAFKEMAMREHYISPVFLFNEIFVRTRTFYSFVNKARILFNILYFYKRFNSFQRIKLGN